MSLHLRKLIFNQPIPLHAAYLYFYAAISQEAVARQMHGMSLPKIIALQQAKSFFEQAAAALPGSNLEATSEDDCSTRSSSAMGDTSSLNESTSSLDGPDTRYSSISSASSPVEDRSSVSDMIFKPPPLRVRKTAQLSSGTISSRKSFFEAMTSITRPDSQQYKTTPGLRIASRVGSNLATSAEIAPDAVSPQGPAPLVIELPDQALSVMSESEPFIYEESSIVPVDDTTVGYREYESVSTESTPFWIQQRAQECYHDHLQDFAHMLQKHIESSHDLIGKTEQAQTRRMSEEKPTISTDDEDAKQANLRARIAKLKQNGWRRERFDPQRYQDLAEIALAEL